MQHSSYVLGKLYSNTLLVVFNNRIFLARARENSGPDASGFEFQTGTCAVPRVTQASPGPANKYMIEIHKETAIEYDHDLELDVNVNSSIMSMFDLTLTLFRTEQGIARGQHLNTR